MSFSFHVRRLAAITPLLFLGACGGGGGGGAPAPSGPTATLPVAAVASRCEALRGGAVADPEVVPVTLAGQFEVPPVATGGIGTGQFTINRTTGELSGSITVTGLSGPANAAHIHTGFAGINGGIIVPLTADLAVPGKFDVPAATVLSAPNLTNFLAGGTYTNAHTTANPGGEVRAQIVPGPIDVVRCEATGDFEVPALANAHNAITYTTVNTSSGAAVINARTSGFTDANAAHLHRAFAGLNGGVVIPLTQTGGIGTDLWEGTGTLAGLDLTGYLAGDAYVNVHTPADPAGHIRTQVVPKSISVLRFLLNGGQEVPPVATGATAVGYITVNTLPGTHAVDANARTTNLVGGNAAHIHQAATGVNGGVIVPLVQPNAAGTPELWATAPGSSFTDAQFTAFLANQTYLNVHTAVNPNGEIRGQIIQP